MSWRCINNYLMIGDNSDKVLSMEDFYRIYGGWLMSISVALPYISINTPDIEYKINEAIITHDGEETHLELSVTEDDETISIRMKDTFVEILDGERITKNGYIAAYIYSKYKDNECFYIAQIKVENKNFNS